MDKFLNKQFMRSADGNAIYFYYPKEVYNGTMLKGILLKEGKDNDFAVCTSVLISVKHLEDSKEISYDTFQEMWFTIILKITQMS